MQVEERIRAIVSPFLEDLSLDLWDVEWSGSRLRILVDKPDGSVNTETLGLVSRILSSELDKADPVPSNYTLEVSSPGIERTLRHEEHFQSSIGELISLKLNTPIEDEIRLSGTLTAVLEDGIAVQTSKTQKEVPYTAIKKAKRIFEWEGK